METPPKIAIVDYGMGNLRSVQKMIVRSGAEVKITSEAADLAWADKLILPGVGAFTDAMKELNNRGLTSGLNAAVLEDRKPILGICLGMELMARGSEEGDRVEGLNWLPAEMVGFDRRTGVRVPHVGWSPIEKSDRSPLFNDIPNGAAFYFVHSYHMACDDPDIVVAQADYGGEFTAAINRGNIWGTQFHPEKSQAVGSALLANFVLEDFG